MAALGAEGRRFESYLPDHFSAVSSPSPQGANGNERRTTDADRDSSHGIVPEGFVYFIRLGVDGPIKVGFATNVKLRLNRLQVGCPYPLTAIHQEPGGYPEEAQWHAALREYRIRGEWFEPNPILFRYLKSVGVAMRECDQWKLRKADRLKECQ